MPLVGNIQVGKPQFVEYEHLGQGEVVRRLYRARAHRHVIALNVAMAAAVLACLFLAYYRNLETALSILCFSFAVLAALQRIVRQTVSRGPLISESTDRYPYSRSEIAGAASTRSSSQSGSGKSDSSGIGAGAGAQAD